MSKKSPTPTNTEVESSSFQQQEEKQGALWSISAVSRVTGLSTHTLRAWERRFGVPVPVRLSSKHRRYTQAQVDRLLLVSQVLERGHRAGDVVPLSFAQLNELLSTTVKDSSQQKNRPEWMKKYYQQIMVFDRKGFYSDLIHEASGLGIRRFLFERIIPLLQGIGLSWRAGEIQVRHEHFATDLLEDALRHLRLSLEAPGNKKMVLLATLSQEQHSLGLQIVALLLALHRFPLQILGTRTPVEDILAASEQLRPGGVGISVTSHTANELTSQELYQLRLQLPQEIPIWLGGNGASQINPMPLGIKMFPRLEDLELIL